MQNKRVFIIPAALLLSLLAYLCSLPLLPTPVARAQAFVIGSDPVDGSTISRVPDEIHIYFNATISPLSSAHIYVAENGKMIDVGASSSTLSGTPARELILAVKNPDREPEGSYEVKWNAVADDDGHTTFGLIGFNVGYSATGLTGTPVLGPTTSNNLDEIRALNFTNLLAILWEWMGLVALTFWIGLVAVEHFFLTQNRLSGLYKQAQKRTASIQGLCLFVILFAECIALILRVTAISGASDLNIFSFPDLLALIVESNYGHWWIARIALVTTALIIFYSDQKKKTIRENETEEKQTSQLVPAAKAAKTTSTPQHKTSTQKLQSASSYTPRKTVQLIETPVIKKENNALTQSSFWILLMAAILVTTIPTSVVASVAEPHWSTLCVELLNAVSQALWLGSFTYLGFILFPMLLGSELEYNTDTLILLLKRFTPLLVVSMGIQLFCFLFVSEVSITGPTDLLNDAYGRILDGQGIILLIEVALTLIAVYRLRPQLTHQALRLPVVHADLPTRRERQTRLNSTGRNLQFLSGTIAILGALLLLGTALLSFFAPPINFPNTTYAAPSLDQISETNAQTQQIGNLTATLQVLPGKSGSANTIILNMVDSNQQPVSNAKIQLTINMSTMDMGTTSITINAGNPTYIAHFDQHKSFDMAGLWNIEVSIQRPGQTTVTGTFSITIAA